MLAPAALINIQYDQRNNFRQWIDKPKSIKTIFRQHKSNRQAGAETAHKHHQECPPLILFRLHIVLQQQGYAHDHGTAAKYPGSVVGFSNIFHVLQTKEQVEDLGPGHYKDHGQNAQDKGINQRIPEDPVQFPKVTFSKKCGKQGLGSFTNKLIQKDKEH